MFDSRSGPLSVARRRAMIELDFPARPAAPAEPSDELIRGLALRPKEVRRSSSMLLCVYASEDEVRALAPDFGSLALVDPERIIVTGPGKDCDFVSRFFAPGVGIPEDPVTGSAIARSLPIERLALARRPFTRDRSQSAEVSCGASSRVNGSRSRERVSPSSEAERTRAAGHLSFISTTPTQSGGGGSSR